jgi:hypothetical protein
MKKRAYNHNMYKIQSLIRAPKYCHYKICQAHTGAINKINQKDTKKISIHLQASYELVAPPHFLATLGQTSLELAGQGRKEPTYHLQ